MLKLSVLFIVFKEFKSARVSQFSKGSTRHTYPYIKNDKIFSLFHMLQEFKSIRVFLNFLNDFTSLLKNDEIIDPFWII